MSKREYKRLMLRKKKFQSRKESDLLSVFVGVGTFVFIETNAEDDTLSLFFSISSTSKTQKYFF